VDVGTGAVELANHLTRADDLVHLRSIVGTAEQRRVIVGVDFPLGYPAGTAAALGLAGCEPWLARWRHLAASIHDGERKENDRLTVAASLNAR